MATLTHTYTRTHNVTRFADPYKMCRSCGGWIDGVLDAPGPLVLSPCEHRSDYRDVCPSWSPVDGCGCAALDREHAFVNPISHEMRQPAPGDERVY